MKLKVFLFFCLFSFLFFSKASGESSSFLRLRELIEQKSSAIQALESQRRELEKNLEEVNKSQSKLTREIGSMNNNISQLQLSIKSNSILIEKLDLEINSLSENVKEIQSDVKNKKQTISKLINELQEKENESLFLILFKNKSLSESISEAESIIALNKDLDSNIKELTNLHEELNKKLKEGEQKKKEKELEKENLKNRQVIIQDQKKEKQDLLTETKNKEKIYEEQLDKLKKLQLEISGEIEDIEMELRRSIDPNILPPQRPGVLLWPVTGGILTQDYGATKFAIRNYPGKYHNGIDIGGKPVGAEILSAEKGIVINVGDQDQYCRKAAYGKFVVVKHENGLTTLYAHMSKTIAYIGKRVERGEIIGYLGKTGWATGPHLHFSVFASNTLSPAKTGLPEGTKPSRSCGPMPVGGDINPMKYF